VHVLQKSPDEGDGIESAAQPNSLLF